MALRLNFCDSPVSQWPSPKEVLHANLASEAKCQGTHPATDGTQVVQMFLEEDVGAGSPARWLAMRTPSLVMGARRAPGTGTR